MIELDTQIIPTARAMSFLFSGRVQLSKCAKNFTLPERYRFNYGRKWVTEKMEMAEILLPSNPDGEPDWEWMETYMKSLPYSNRIE